MSSEDSECSQNGSRVNSESNPNYNADINQIASSHSQLYKALPLQIRRRIKALKKLQLESVRIESEFFIEVHKLECKYNELYSGVYKTRRDIVSGEKEPTEEECDFPFDDILDDSVPSEDNKEPGFSPYGAVDLNTKGIPYFWLTIFKNVDLLNDMVQPHDEPILKHLIDIQVDLLEKDPMGFVLKFIFSPNEYFSNTVLTKSYEMRCKPDESDPFSFEGPEIIKCKGCTIDWHKNKNVTQRTIKKKQKQKSQSTKRIITTTVKNDSFFNFFNPPHVPEDEDEDVDGDTQDILTIDFEIGHSIRERIVPHAVLWFTGEALDEDFEEEEEEEDEDDDDNEITDNSDEQPAVVVRRRDLKNHRQMRHSRKQFIDDITDDSEDENAKIVPRPKGKKGKKIAQPGPECAQM